jgi:hypothetical protein
VIDDDLDRALRERFQALRAEDARRAPDFADLLARAQAPEAIPIARPRRGRPPARALRWTLAAGALAAAAIAGILAVPRDAHDDFETLVRTFSSQVGSGLWRSPTDGLLEVPGIELVRSVPAIGGRPRWPSPLPDAAGPRGARSRS